MRQFIFRVSLYLMVGGVFLYTLDNALNGVLGARVVHNTALLDIQKMTGELKESRIKEKKARLAIDNYNLHNL